LEHGHPGLFQGNADDLADMQVVINDENAVRQRTLREVVLAYGLTLLGVQEALQSPASKAPGTPGCHLSPLLFYKATMAGNKRGVEPAKGHGPVDRRQRLRSQGKQIAYVGPHALAAGFAAMADIVVGNDSGEIDQRADVARCRKCNEAVQV